MAAPFQPPSTEGKPEVPKWDPPPPPTEDIDYAKLHTIDLALVDSPDRKVVEQLIATAKEAIHEDGFLYLVNYRPSKRTPPRITRRAKSSLLRFTACQ